MRRDRPAAMMLSTVLDPFTGSGTTGLVALRSPVTQSANGSDSPVSFVISENLKRVPHWDSVGKYRKSVFSFSRREFESL